jgi:hypothetical protein
MTTEKSFLKVEKPPGGGFFYIYLVLNLIALPILPGNLTTKSPWHTDFKVFEPYNFVTL